MATIDLGNVIGPAGPKGDTGAQGTKGDTGATGPAGPGVATGGSTNQVLYKTGAANYATGWKTLSAADVGAATMTQVNAAINTAITGAMGASY